MIKKCLWILLFFPLLSFANIANWQIVPQESSLNFTGTQNNAPVLGKFTRFSGDILFDPTQLQQSKIHIIIDMTSVTADFTDVSDTLKGADWFNTKAYPQAQFTASHFTKTGDKTYQATGMLTIRDKTMPAVITFTLDEYTQSKARVNGSISLKRLDYGIGQGEWQSTSNVKDDVKVQFTVTAIPK